MPWPQTGELGKEKGTRRRSCDYATLLLAAALATALAFATGRRNGANAIPLSRS